jgi:TolB protein
LGPLLPALYGWLASCALLVAVAIPASAEAASQILYAHRDRLDFVTSSGAHLRTIKDAGNFTVDLAASDNGRRLAVLQNTGTDGAHGEYYRLYIRTVGVPGLREIFSGGPIPAAGAPGLALSPNGRLLAVSIDEEIRIIDLETGHRRKLRVQRNGFDIQPSFTADGRHLVFCHGTYPSPFRVDVYEIALDGGRTRRLTHSRADEFFPQLSPDGRRLAFLRRHGSNGFDLIVSRADGSRQRVLRHVRNLSARPDFSPSGRRLAFAWVATDERGSLPPWKLFTVKLDGSGLRAVVQGVHGGPLLPQWTRSP